MQDLLSQLPVLGGVLATVFLGPALAIAALLHRKRRARQRRRSPLGIQLLRSPGHTLREQVDEASKDLMWDISMLMVLPLLVLAVFLAQAHVRTLPGMQHLAPVYVLLTLLFIALVLRKLMKTGSLLDRLRAGLDAEVAVGQELDQLMRQGAAVFHDFPGEGFNIDHVVISRVGLFAVETKGYTKRSDQAGRAAARVIFDGASLAFPGWTTREPIEQAERQAQWLSKWISSATGEAITASPVVALPGWFVERKRLGSVRVYSGRELARLLVAAEATPLSPDTVQRVAHQVEQRCRDVAPTFGASRAN
jgi:hypothetical protein